MPRFLRVLLFLVVPTISLGENLLLNGDFESGLTGFSTDYATPSLLNSGGDANVFETGQTFRLFSGTPIPASPDNTTGSGKSLLANGATTGSLAVYRNTFQAIAGQTYDIEYAYSNWAFGAGNNSALLQLTVGGASLGGTLDTRPAGTGWLTAEFEWTAPATGIVELEITEVGRQSSGNDFALDDISVKTRIPEPSSTLLLTAAALVAARRR